MYLLKRIKTYFSTHFAASFSLVLGLVALLLVFCLQRYLQQAYLRYLLEQSYETENAALESMQRNMEVTIREILELGAEMAADEEIYNLAVRADQSLTGTNVVNDMWLQLYRELQTYGYARNVASVAVVREEGILSHYDMMRTMEAMLWQGENLAQIDSMIECYFGEDAYAEFPRIMAFTQPAYHQGHPDKQLFHIVYPLTGSKASIWKTEYILVITYYMDVFEELLKAIDMPKVEYIRGYIADSDGISFYHGNQKLPGENQELLTQGDHITHITREVNYFGWTIGVIIDEAQMQEHISSMYHRSSLVYVAMLLVGVAVVFIWFRKLMRPVRRMSESMTCVEHGDLHSKIRIEGKHEIWQIAEEYNRMIEAIEHKNRQIERQHLEKLESVEQKYQAEREALESQINAHFICNTLGCINYEAIEEGNEKVSILIKKLSNILRYSFDQKSQNVYIYQEIAWIDQYLYLQKCRLEQVFDYSIDFPEIYGHWPCCKLMFQPFVENSILHGFEGRKDDGRILIYGEMAGERLKIVIEDNGCGMDAETEREIQQIFRDETRLALEWNAETGKTGKRRGIGIRNVVTRMRMYYGSRFEISMETAPGKGTRFVFLIPIPGAEEEEEQT